MGWEIDGKGVIAAAHAPLLPLGQVRLKAGGRVRTHLVDVNAECDHLLDNELLVGRGVKIRVKLLAVGFSRMDGDGDQPLSAYLIG